MHKRWWQKFDWWLASASAGLLLVGLAMIASSTLGTSQPYATNQLLFAVVGVAVCVALSRVDFRILIDWAFWGYGTILGLLVLVTLLGQIRHGAESWLQVGPFTLQPSEFAKLGLVLVIAKLYHRSWQEQWPAWKLIAWIVAAVLPPTVLILLQPDFGTASVLMVTGFLALWLSPVSKKILAGFLISVVVIGLLGWQVLAPYQKQRVTTFLNPGSNPLGSGYNVLQSQIAVGSGELWGLGWGRGTQSHLNFLPEHHTDFIFASLSEEFGFVGALIVLALYGVVLWRGVRLAWQAADRQTVILSMGISLMLLFQALVNMAMNVGLAPVTGVPLPLVSYGGSSLLTTLMAIGLLESIAMHQPEEHDIW